MKIKMILFLLTISIGLSAQADYTVQTYQPFYPAQAMNYSNIQPYNQGYYQNPYQTQCQGQYANPYQYQTPYYGYGNNSPYPLVNSAITGNGITNGTPQIVKNIGQSLLYSMIRGY